MYSLQPPFDTFRLEVPKGGYKNFNLPSDSDYPLRGVTYPVDYGDIKGYIAEDGANLDLFVGSDPDGLIGYIKVSRPELAKSETKIYIQATEDEEKAIIEAFSPVIVASRRIDSIEELQNYMQQFKVQD